MPARPMCSRVSEVTGELPVEPDGTRRDERSDERRDTLALRNRRVVIDLVRAMLEGA